ncbi:bacterial regulatory helix-turn-helix protein, AraC family protein [Asticcacaulis biprosthecium C19]|uniref:Bacterial regulatory helix-turn-helix protein, AraC family protein n=1 Tax=Asticcacaulis biprosthecium C19 TaxID=715226 RepID=F4QU45_9CAUL|nr:AraC family transcriptional regulator [Asticcacaulis biprosthecium]EGF89345.1 bacterial regulatory helix-turn-helix protein, AraC family protein [Asticcacaulis biprosthecium C19]
MPDAATALVLGHSLVTQNLLIQTSLAAMALGISLAGAVAALRARRGEEGRWLAGVFALLGAMSATPLMANLWLSGFVFYLPVLLPVLFALLPVLHRYVLEMATMTSDDGGESAKKGGDGRWHLVLPALGGVVTAGFWALPDDDRRAMLLRGVMPDGAFPATLALASFGLILVWNVVSAGYLVSIVRHLVAYRARLRDLLSNVAGFEMRWVEGLIGLLVLLWGVVALSLLSDNLTQNSVSSPQWVLLLTICVEMLLTAFGLSPGRLRPLPQASDDAPQTPVDLGQKYAKSALSADNAQRIAERMERVMRDEQLYMDPNLSLDKLSRRTAAAPNLVSQTLNETLGVTFFDYINTWRIAAAKPLILSDQRSILEIAYASGFNSRSTFYTAFRKVTGLSPNQYRKLEPQSDQRIVE